MAKIRYTSELFSANERTPNERAPSLARVARGGTGGGGVNLVDYPSFAPPYF